MPEQPFQHTQGTDERSVYGYKVDVIASVSIATNDPEHWESYIDEVDDLVDSLRLNSSSQKLEEWKWKVPIAGAKHPTREGFAYRLVSVRVSYRNFRDLLRRSKAIENAEESAYCALLTDKVAGWRFVLTKEGRCGVAPPKVRVGDLVSVLCGGTVPFIFRKTKRNASLRLIGEAYISDIMNGELAADFTGEARQRFTIY